MIKLLSPTLFLCLLLVIASCSNTQEVQTNFDETVTWWVKPYKVPCPTGNGECLQVAAVDDYEDAANWDYVSEEITGFDFRPGFAQKIRVGIVNAEPATVEQHAAGRDYQLLQIFDELDLTDKSLHDIYALERIDGREITMPEGMERPRLELNTIEGRLHGTDGCNTINADFELLGKDKVRIGSIMSTRMMCPDMTVPNAVSTILPQVNLAHRDGLRLVLSTASGDHQLTYRKVD